MFPVDHETGIVRNIKVVEWLKADLLTSLSALFRAMLRGNEERLVDALASIILNCYILGKRLGISFSRLDLKVEAKLRDGIDDDHEVERWYGDLTHLLSHLTAKKR